MTSLSIIIPHYNAAATLARLLATTPRRDDIEIIVVDDKSQPQQVAAVKQLAADYSFTLIENKTARKGPGIARNIGIEQAQGDWYFFADNDDFLLENFYEKVQPYFESDNDVVFFCPISQYPDGTEANRHSLYKKVFNDYNNNPSRKHILQLKFLASAAWFRLIRAELIRQNNIAFDETMTGEDIMFSAKVGYFMKQFAVSQDKIYCVIRRKNSVTTKRNEKILMDGLNKVIERYKYVSEKIPATEMKQLDFGGYDMVRSALQSPELSAWKVFLMLRKNGVPTITLRVIAGIMQRYLSPAQLWAKIKWRYRDKRYGFEQ